MNSRLDSIQAGVLNVKLPYIIEWTNKRIQVAQWYFENLDDIEGLSLPLVRKESKHSFHVFGVIVQRRDELLEYLKQNGVSAQIHYPKAMPFMPAYSYLGHKESEFPESFKLQNEELSLPIYPEMSKEQVMYISVLIRSFFGK